MVNRLLVWAGGNSQLERVVNTNSLAAKMVHRYVAGPALEDGVAAAVRLNGQRIRGILDLLGEAVTNLGSAWYPYLMRRMAERPANLLFFLRAAVGR
jgi:hypothetical protein